MNAKRIVLFILVAALCLAFAVPYVEVNAEPVTLGIAAFAGMVIALLGAYGISMTATHASRPRVAQMTMQLWQDWQTETATPVDSGLGNQLELVRDSQNNQFIRVSKNFMQKFKSFSAWLAQAHPELLYGDEATLWSHPGSGTVSVSGIGDFPLIFDAAYADWHDREWHQGDELYPESANLLSRYAGAGDLLMPSGCVMHWLGGSGNPISGPSAGPYTLRVELPDGTNWPSICGRYSTSSTEGKVTEYVGTLGLYLVHGFTDGIIPTSDMGTSVMPGYFAYGATQMDYYGYSYSFNSERYHDWGFLLVNIHKYTPKNDVANSNRYSVSPYYYYSCRFYSLDATVGYIKGQGSSGNQEVLYDVIFGDAPLEATFPASIVAVPDGAVDVPTWDIPADRDVYVGADFIYPGVSLDAALDAAIDNSVVGTIADSNLRTLDAAEVETLETDTSLETVETVSTTSDTLQPVIGLDTVFPFCIPFDVAFFVERLQAARVAPVIEWPIVVPSLGIDEMITVDLSGWETVAAILRTLELIVFVIGLAYATRSMFIRG